MDPPGHGQRIQGRVQQGRATRLRGVPRKAAHTIVGKIESLALDPFAANNNVSRLTAVDGYRLRIGDWRVLYSLDAEAHVLTVAAILPRGEAYR